MLLVLLALLPFSLVASPTRVNTPYGAVEGFQYSLPGGKAANVFLGIPYAQPPVGELRFEKPKRAENWNTVIQAKEFGAFCFQHSSAKRIAGKNVSFSEDCLTMNIMAPSEKSADPSGYPVMVFIHGGGFELGSAGIFPYENISQNFIPEGIVFVTFNYRLSAFGFLSTGDKVVPGNLGYWDMTLALQFIRDSIANFGGNPGSVTVTGESAGASSVSALTFSPHSNTLFHRAIAMSGSQYSSYANSTNSIDSTRRLAKALGCQGCSSKKIVACLKQKSAEEIRAAIGQLGFSNDEFNFLLFTPLIDGAFLPYETDKLLQEAPKIPTIQGVTDQEGGFFSLYKLPTLFKTNIPSDKWKTYSAEDLTQFLKQKMIVKNYGSQKDALIAKMIDFYVNSANNESYLQRYADLFTHLFFAVPAYQEAQDKAAAQIPVYLYREEFTNILTKKMPFSGAFHGNELCYLLGSFVYGRFEFDDADRAFQRDLLSGFISFAKTGNPIVGGRSWEPVTKTHPGRYMSFSANSQMKDNFCKEAVDFWTKDVCEIGGVEVMLRETLVPALKCA